MNLASSVACGLPRGFQAEGSPAAPNRGGHVMRHGFLDGLQAEAVS